MNMLVNSNTSASMASAIGSTEPQAPDNARVDTLEKVESIAKLLSKIRHLMAKEDEETRKAYVARENLAIEGQYTAAQLAVDHHKSSIDQSYKAAAWEFAGGLTSAVFGFAGNSARLSPSAGQKTEILGAVGTSAGNGLQSGFRYASAGESNKAETSKLASDMSQTALNQHMNDRDRAHQDRDAIRQQHLELERAITDLIVEGIRAVRQG